MTLRHEGAQGGVKPPQSKARTLVRAERRPQGSRVSPVGPGKPWPYIVHKAKTAKEEET
jgi:hypothetical protein